MNFKKLNQRWFDVEAFLYSRGWPEAVLMKVAFAVELEMDAVRRRLAECRVRVAARASPLP